ncbi:MAG: DUF2326 domain-containing protein [Bacilli bacterium]|nr:DUF2326 domain-containing protein [Bacilli bacterium]
MKILNIEIYSPSHELLREVKFNEKGLSVIYGDVEKPKSENETSNSIGKTVLLKMINLVFGAKNSGNDTIKGLNDYIVKATVKLDNAIHNVELTIGDSKNYYIDHEKYTYTKYKEALNIKRDLLSKQIMLEKRKNLISNLSTKANKEDISTVLKLLYLDNINLVFRKIKKLQDNIDLIAKFNNSNKDDVKNVERELFDLEMKKKKVDFELESLSERIKKLKVSEEIKDISQQRVELDQNIKSKSELVKINSLRIENYSQLINDAKKSDITALDVTKIYENAKIEIPSLIKKKLEEVEKFYLSLSEDKINLYSRQISNLEKKNKQLMQELAVESAELDRLSEIISINASVLEAIKIYDLKSKEKMDIDTSIAEINGKMAKINDSKNIKSEIDVELIKLEEEFNETKELIGNYKEFIYKIVGKIYGDNRQPYLNISPTDSNRKYKTMPVTIELNYDGDSGEGLTSSKYLIFDYLIMNYNNEINVLIEDSSCFEAIDRRQIKNIINEGIDISNKKDKQYIISLNKYLLDDSEFIKDYIVVSLNENDTLLNIKF